MLTKRQNNILKLIVEEYIQLAKPVGSDLISKKINCSPATARNEMSDLEEIGLLEKTHTSSGRIPSATGYNYYIKNLMDRKKMKKSDMEKLEIIFNNHQLALSDCISKSLQVVSDMTSYTSVILGSNSHDNLLKLIEVVPIGENAMTIIVVTDKGHVENKTIVLEDVEIEDVKKTVSLINNLITGTPIDEVSMKLEYEVKPIIGKYVNQHEQIYNAFYHVFTDFTDNNSVNVVGKNKFLEQPEFSSLEKIKGIYNKLDNKDILRKITSKNNDDSKDIEIYIGEESQIDEDMAVIKTKYKTKTDEGTIAIIGPKRMEYERVINLLEFIKENIER